MNKHGIRNHTHRELWRSRKMWLIMNRLHWGDFRLIEQGLARSGGGEKSSGINCSADDLVGNKPLLRAFELSGKKFLGLNFSLVTRVLMCLGLKLKKAEESFELKFSLGSLNLDCPWLKLVLYLILTKIELIKRAASNFGRILIANDKGKISDELNLIAMAEEKLRWRWNEAWMLLKQIIWIAE